MHDLFSLPKTAFLQPSLWGSSIVTHQIEGDNIYFNLWEKRKEGGIWSHWCVEKKSGKECNPCKMNKKDVEFITSFEHQVYRSGERV